MNKLKPPTVMVEGFFYAYFAFKKAQYLRPQTL